MPPAYGHSTVFLCHELCSIITQLHEGELTHRGTLGHKLTPTPGSRHSSEDWASVLPHRRLYLNVNIDIATHTLSTSIFARYISKSAQMMLSHTKSSSHCMKQTNAKGMLVSGFKIILCMTAPGLTCMAAVVVHRGSFNQSSIRSTVAD